jgi:hypothetical protein
MQAARTAGELVKVRNAVEELQQAAAFEAPSSRAPEVAAAQLVGAAGSEHDALRLGIIEGVAAVADGLEAAEESLCRYDSAKLEASGPACDAWGVVLQPLPADLELHPAAVVLFREGGLANLVRDICGALQTVASHKGVAAVLSGPQAQSRLVAVQTNVDIISKAAEDFDRLAKAVERATGAQALAAHAFAAAIVSPKDAKEGAPVALLAAAFVQPLSALRGAISKLAAAAQRADVLRALVDKHNASDLVLSGRLAEADSAVESACKDIREAADHANAVLSSEEGLEGALTAAAERRYLEATATKGGALLDLDNAARAATAHHGQLSAARALSPILQLVLHELSAALSECVSAAAGGSGLKVPARWHVGNDAMSNAPPTAAPTLWGGTSIWGGTPGIWAATDTGTGQSKRQAWHWPASLSTHWASCAALFAVDAILQAATMPPADAAQTDLPPRLTGHAHVAAVDAAERCTGEALACGPAAGVLAMLRGLTKNLMTPPAAVARLPPAVPIARPQRESPVSQAAPLWPLPPPQQPVEAPRTHMQSLGRVAAQPLLPPQQQPQPHQEGERELQAFTFFDESICGADIMLGGLSETSSLEAQSVGDPAEALAGEGSSGVDESHLQMQTNGLQGSHKQAAFDFKSASAFPWANLGEPSEAVWLSGLLFGTNGLLPFIVCWPRCTLADKPVLHIGERAFRWMPCALHIQISHSPLSTD